MRFTQHVDTDKKASLDLKDRKILRCLAGNARMPRARIAREVGLSKDAVRYRLRNLEREGVIQGYVSVIETSRLGYDTYHIFLRMKHMDREVREKLIGIFRSHPFVKVIIEFSGKYDFEIGVLAKSLEELDEHMTRIIDSASEYLQEHTILAISRYLLRRVFPRGFIEAEEPSAQAKPGLVKVDETDMDIVTTLSKKADSPLHEIGSKVGLSADAVNYRLRRLMKEGLVVRHVPVINYSSLDYTMYAVFMNINNLDSKREKVLEGFLRDSRSVVWAVKTIGRYNLLMYVCVKGPEELHQTIMGLRDLFPSDVKDYETLVGYEEYKYTYLPEGKEPGKEKA